MDVQDQEQSNTDQEQSAKGKEGTVDTTATPAGNTGVSFTQAQVDAMIGKARMEARSVASNSILEELGIDNLDGLKGALGELDKLKKASMSESEQLQAELEKAEADKQAALEAANAAKVELINTKKSTQLRNVLTEEKADHAQDLMLILEAKHGTELAACFDENGVENDGMLSAFLKKHKPNYPHYFGTTGGGSPSNSGGVPPGDTAEANEAARARIRKINRG